MRKLDTRLEKSHSGLSKYALGSFEDQQLGAIAGGSVSGKLEHPYPVRCSKWHKNAWHQRRKFANFIREAHSAEGLRSEGFFAGGKQICGRQCGLKLPTD